MFRLAVVCFLLIGFDVACKYKELCTRSITVEGLNV